MRLGIDVSENNGHINWEAVKAAGVKFAIIRLGYGNCHLDGMFYENINGAIDAGLDVGVYYYSYALDEDMALNEAKFLIETLEDAGLYNENLPMGIWFDMEDADGYKSRHGNPDNREITDMCFVFVLECNKADYNCGIYANLDWLENRIDTDSFADYVPFWCAQWGKHCSFGRATLWQFTDKLLIDGQYFDGDYEL